MKVALEVISLDDLEGQTIPEVVEAARWMKEWVETYHPKPEDVVVYFFSIEGLTPLLQHRPALKVGRGRQVKYDPAEEAERAAYRLPDGRLYLKHDVFRALIRDTSIIFRYREREAFLRSILFVRPEQIPLVDPQDGYITNYEIFESVGMLNPRVGRVTQWRPMIRRWRVDFLVALAFGLIAKTQQNLAVLPELIQTGGIYIGIGDWRPVIVKAGKTVHTGGEYGRFSLIKAFIVD